MVSSPRLLVDRDTFRAQTMSSSCRSVGGCLRGFPFSFRPPDQLVEVISLIRRQRRLLEQRCGLGVHRRRALMRGDRRALPLDRMVEGASRAFGTFVGTRLHAASVYAWLPVRRRNRNAGAAHGEVPGAMLSPALDAFG